MTTKQQVIDAHRKHPDWDDLMIALVLECEDEYVRATARRNSLILPSRWRRAVPGETFRGPDGEVLVATGRLE
jgi:hypothetical protein